MVLARVLIVQRTKKSIFVLFEHHRRETENKARASQENPSFSVEDTPPKYYKYDPFVFAQVIAGLSASFKAVS